MTHGYGIACVFFSKIIVPLSESYRIVMFDNLGWGLSQRVENVGDALESPEKSERWIENLLDTTVDALIANGDVPEKFYLSGHSAGGHMSMVYASRNPHRVEALFLQSPPAENW